MPYFKNVKTLAIRQDSWDAVTPATFRKMRKSSLPALKHLTFANDFRDRWGEEYVYEGRTMECDLQQSPPFSWPYNEAGGLFDYLHHHDRRKYEYLYKHGELAFDWAKLHRFIEKIGRVVQEDKAGTFSPSFLLPIEDFPAWKDTSISFGIPLFRRHRMHHWNISYYPTYFNDVDNQSTQGHENIDTHRHWEPVEVGADDVLQSCNTASGDLEIIGCGFCSERRWIEPFPDMFWHARPGR